MGRRLPVTTSGPRQAKDADTVPWRFAARFKIPRRLTFSADGLRQFAARFVVVVGPIYDLRAGDAVEIRQNGRRSMVQIFWFKTEPIADDQAEIVRMVTDASEVEGVAVEGVRAFHGHAYAVAFPRHGRCWNKQQGDLEACRLFETLLKAGY